MDPSPTLSEKLDTNTLSRAVTLTNEHEDNPAQSAAPKALAATGDKDLESDIKEKILIDEVPDGGYGWVIVGACTTITFFFVGLTYSWGVLQADLVKRKLGSDSTLSFVGSITIAMISLGAIINSRVIQWLGTRNAALLASCLLGLSQILCGWVTNSIAGLFVCNSVIGGLGVSIFFMVCGALPAQYFKRKRGITSGIIFAGGGIGGGVLSIAIGALLNHVGLAWTFRIMGFMTLAFTLPASLLLKERTSRVPANIDWSLFRDAKFVLLLIGSGIATFPLLVPPFFLPTYAETLGITPTMGSILLAVFNIASAFGRIGFGFLGDVVGPTTALFLALFINSISLLAIWPVANSMAVLIVFIVINGMGGGGFFSTIPAAVSYIYGPKKTPSALSMTVTGWVAGYTMGAPVAGYILSDYGGSGAGATAFRPAIFYAGAMSMGSAFLILCVRHLMIRKVFGFA